MARSPRTLRIRRHQRVRFRVVGTAERPRVAVSRSNKHIAAQVIDDDAGRTLAAASSNEPELRSVAFTLVVDKQEGRRFSGTFRSKAHEKCIALISSDQQK